MNLINVFSNINPKEVLKNLPDAVFVIDADGKINWVNDKATIIFEAGRSLLKNYYFEDLIDGGMEVLEKSAARRVSVVAGAFTPNAKEFFVELNAKKIDLQYFVTIRDVTAMTHVLAMAEKTGRLNKEKNTMLAKLSNEFKSPLQSITGFSQALLDGVAGALNDKQSKYIKIINKNSAELLNFMDKFLEFAQAESSLFTPEFQTFDVIATLQNIIKLNEPALLSKNILINLDCDELRKRAIYSEENYIKMIFNNILETSIKMTDIGSISVKVYNPDINVVKSHGIDVPYGACDTSYVMISVKDSGMGLTEAEFDGLFEPYTQLDKSNKKSFLRTLSLGTANVLLKKINGVMWAESEVMRGSTFNIIIPVEKYEILSDEDENEDYFLEEEY